LGLGVRRANLDEKFIDVMTATYGGMRIGAQELDGVLLQDVEGSLWPRELIERGRVEPLTARLWRATLSLKRRGFF
jgi:phage terminase large subunit-like protein